MAAQTPLTDARDLNPLVWFDYLDTRLEAGVRPSTVALPNLA